ncbi:hypothetical protein [Arhodomonas sp. AD133]|uniref:hypothetical protein n=1 Tax=Arhodomonas sp. AD133 TaxID=3415009 RepID=UPI003EC00978
MRRAHQGLVARTLPCGNRDRAQRPDHSGVTDDGGLSPLFRGRYAYERDASADTPTYVFDERRRIVHPDERLERIRYNEYAQVTRHVDQRGTVPRHECDDNGNPIARVEAAGNRTSTTDPLDRTTKTAHDGAGHRVSVTDAANQTTAYYHDDAGALTGIDCPGGAYVVRDHFQGRKSGPFDPAEEDEARGEGGAG